MNTDNPSSEQMPHNQDLNGDTTEQLTAGARLNGLIDDAMAFHAADVRHSRTGIDDLLLRLDNPDATHWDVRIIVAGPSKSLDVSLKGESSDVGATYICREDGTAERSLNSMLVSRPDLSGDGMTTYDIVPSDQLEADATVAEVDALAGIITDANIFAVPLKVRHYPSASERPNASQQPGILDSVASQGLLAHDLLVDKEGGAFPSADEKARDFVAGVYLEPPVTEEFKRRLRSGLYAGAESVFPVILERPGETRHYRNSVPKVTDEIIKSECERRAAASFVVVCNSTDPDRNRQSHISPEQFTHVLMPPAVYDLYAQSQTTRFPSATKVVVVDTKVDQVIEDGIHMELALPDYEGALTQIIDSEQRSVFVHAVRLPLDDEIQLFE
jgi:hypothetical protein